MSPDPTKPLPPSDPVIPPASADSWVAPPQAPDPYAAVPYPTPPYSAPPIPPYSAAPYSAPYSAPPAAAYPAAAYPAPPGPLYSAPPYSAPPGPHPPAMAYPAPPPAGFASAPQGAAAVQIGEIMVSPPLIHTPAGMLPLAGASWHVSDYWQREEKIAPWAVVCAIVGFFCLTFFSLLFLLIKETRHHGTVQVTVMNGVQQYVARIPVTDQGQVQHINNQVNYARSLSAG